MELIKTNEKAAEAALHSTAHIIKNSNTHDIKACDKKQAFSSHFSNHSPFNLNNAIVSFQDEMYRNGLHCKDTIIADGEIHRFKHNGDKNPDGWYILFDNKSFIAGVYGYWKDSTKQKWSSKSMEQLTVKERNDYSSNMNRAKEALQAEIKKRHVESQKKAQEKWDKASCAPDNHSYLSKKQVKPYSIKVKDERLIIPLRDHNTTIHSLQYIFPSGEKRFLAGGAIAEHYHTMGKPTDKLYICEGYATGATIHEATDCEVVIAFNAGNLPSVAKVIKNKYPKKDIIICADNDAFTEAGNAGIEKATTAAQDIGAKLVVPEFKDTTTKPTDFNDLMLLEGINEVKSQLNNPVNVGETSNKEIKKTILPFGYSISDEGVFFEELDKEGNPSPKIFICSKIDVIACTRDTNSLNHGRLLEFKNTLGVQHEWAMPMEALAGDGTDYRRILLNQGVKISSGRKAREKLTEYLSNSNPQKTCLSVDRTGWCKETFIFPDETIGNTQEEDIRFQSMTYNIAGFRTSGSLEEWRNNVSRLCIGNSRLILAICTAFAAPLLELLNEEGGGFHLNGASSTGKTTVLKVACSVWGERERLQNWRATSNGLEGVAALHNDSLLCLDEMSQVDPKDAGETAYMLANGIGKNRSRKDGSLQKKASWRLLFISSGEIGLATHISQTGKKAKAGQQVRLLDIPADVGKGLGIFDNLHGFANGSELARHLDQKTKHYYGLPIREFLRNITSSSNKKELIKNINSLSQNFINGLSITNADGQVKRAANRFSLIAAAGALASILGITGWEEEEAIKAIKICFQDWLNSRGGTNSQEELQIISQVKEFFQKNSSGCRLISWSNCSNSKTINKAGFYKTNNFGDNKRKVEFFIETEIFKKEICEGLNHRQVAKVCVKKDWLMPDNLGNAASTHRAPDTDKPRRFYHFNDKVLGDENEE